MRAFFQWIKPQNRFTDQSHLAQITRGAAHFVLQIQSIEGVLLLMQVTSKPKMTTADRGKQKRLNDDKVGSVIS